MGLFVMFMSDEAWMSGMMEPTVMKPRRAGMGSDSHYAIIIDG